jgi:hypothetical protein
MLQWSPRRATVFEKYNAINYTIIPRMSAMGRLREIRRIGRVIEKKL